MVRRLALYKAQEGATIAKLEQLQASISLPGTLKAIWSLRTFGRTSAALLVVWAWFYLGSQATTSEYNFVAYTGGPRTVPMAYFNFHRPSIFSTTADVPDTTLTNLNSLVNVLTAHSNALTYNGVYPARYDINGAALLPYLRADGTFWSPMGYISDSGQFQHIFPLKRLRHGYHDVSKAQNLYPSSLLGTNIFTYNTAYGYGLSINNMQGTYYSNNTYLNATCRVSSAQDATAFPDGTDAKSQVSINMTKNDNILPLQPQNPPSLFNVWVRNNFTGSVIRASCYLEGVTMEVNVNCLAGDCGVIKMRPTPGVDSINRTAFDDSRFAATFFNSLLYSNGIPVAQEYGQLAPSNTSTVASSIISSFYSAVNGYEGESPSQVKYFTDSSVSFQMTQLINTYYQASLDPLQGSWTDPMVQADLKGYEVFDGANAGKISAPGWTLGRFVGQYYNPQYYLSPVWIAIDITSCVILLAAAIFAFWLRRRTLAPDIFGYVSSLTRDNPHLNLPDGGSTMSGMERSRMLKRLRVKIADVQDENGVGKVGLRYAGPAADFNVQMAHLKPDRQYV